MKKILSVFASVILILSSAVLAETKPGEPALEHVIAAIEEAKANRPDALVKHAGMAMEELLAVSITADGVTRERVDTAAEELGKAIDHTKMGHLNIAMQHAETALSALKAALN